MTSFYGVSAATVPVFIIIYAVGNLLGPLTLGRLFDTIGRKPMIAATYLGSAAVSVVLAVLFRSGSLTAGSFIAIVVVVFFLASAGASAAYLTASELFPMETRALAIAFFFAIGTAVGGITGPLLFGKLIATGHKDQVAIGFLIGAAVMALGGIAELLFGIKAEGEQLEDVAKPLTAEDAEQTRPADADASGHDEKEPQPDARREQRLRRYRPGPGRMPASRVPAVTSLVSEPSLDNEVQSIQRALHERGPTERAELARLVGARFWGPGIFRAALGRALAEGGVRRLSRTTFAAGDGHERVDDDGH
jgi:MFS family permease